MRAGDLLNRLEDRPFRAFRVHMSDVSIYDITEPGMVVVGMSSAILPLKWVTDEEGRKLFTKWRTISIEHIVQFSDVDEGNGKRRRRKSA